MQGPGWGDPVCSVLRGHETASLSLSLGFPAPGLSSGTMQIAGTLVFWVTKGAAC